MDNFGKCMKFDILQNIPGQMHLMFINGLLAHVIIFFLVSTQVVCERLSVMQRHARLPELFNHFARNSLFLTTQEYPPWKWKVGQNLALWVLTTQEYPPPKNINLGRSWHFGFRLLKNTPLPQKYKFRQILAL